MEKINDFYAYSKRASVSGKLSDSIQGFMELVKSNEKFVTLGVTYDNDYACDLIMFKDNEFTIYHDQFNKFENKLVSVNAKIIVVSIIEAYVKSLK